MSLVAAVSDIMVIIIANPTHPWMECIMVCAFPPPPPPFTGAADRCGGHNGSDGGETLARSIVAIVADRVGSIGLSGIHWCHKRIWRGMVTFTGHTSTMGTCV